MHFLKKRMERLSLAMTPAVLTAAMVVLAAIPLRIPGMPQLMPVFALINIYYWDTFVPGMLPYLFLFALGLLEDTLTGLPLGLSSFLNIVFALLLLRERKNVGKAVFGAVWLGFVSLSFIVFGLEWLIMSIYTARLLPVTAHLLQWLATCFAYPPVHLLLTRVYRSLRDA